MIYSYVIRYRRNENSFLLEKIKDIKSWLRKKRLFVLLKQSDRMSWFRQNRTWCSRTEPLSVDLGRGIIFLCFLGLWGTSWNLNSFGAVHPLLGSSDPTERQDQGPGSSQAQRRGRGECTRRCFLAPIFGGGQHWQLAETSICHPELVLRWSPPWKLFWFSSLKNPSSGHNTPHCRNRKKNPELWNH